MIMALMPTSLAMAKRSAFGSAHKDSLGSPLSGHACRNSNRLLVLVIALTSTTVIKTHYKPTPLFLSSTLFSLY